MSGHAHYKNSQISMNNYQPVHLNLFQVIITPPPFVAKWQYVLEEITKISGLATDQTPPAGIEQTYKGAKRSFSNSLADTTVVDLTIGFQVNADEENSMIAYAGMKEWCNAVWNPLNATMKLKKNYIGGPITVFLYNQEEEVIREWIFPVVWPTTPLAAMELDYADGAQIYSFEMGFRSDYWEDITK